MYDDPEVSINYSWLPRFTLQFLLSTQYSVFGKNGDFKCR